MPKPEEIAPWATLPAAARERYPRKNVYFIGEGQEDVYDYLIWRANVRGYKTLSGETARSSAELIHDLLRRAFLRDMLDQDLADTFASWRRKHYEAAGIAIREADTAETNPPHAAVPHADSPRFSAFMRARWPVRKSVRLKIWARQNGKCAACGAERRLSICRETPAASGTGEDNDDHIDATAASQSDVAPMIALCGPCHRRMPQRFMPLRDRPA
jgi:hypothetical protein